MPELLSIHGRCPRCSQLLTVPAGQLQSVFRCARCQYRVPGSLLVDEAKASPPRLGPNAPVLGPFDEDPDDQHTRMHLPGSSGEDEVEVPLAAVLVDNTRSVPPRSVPALQRFDAVAEDGDDQQTRLHVAGSFDSAVPARYERPSAPSPARLSAPPPVPAPVNPARAAATVRRAPVRDATLLGMRAAPGLAPLDRMREDSDDQATRMLLPGESLNIPSLSNRSRDQTLHGLSSVLAPQLPPEPAPAALQRFDQVPEDSDDQNTRLQVPISYEEEQAPAPQLRPLVATRSLPASVLATDSEPFPPRGMQRFGLATLQLSRVMDEWLHDRRMVLLVTLALLVAIIAPALDAVLGNTRHGATVIAANLVLFFLWTLWLAWFGKQKNDAGVWDYRVGLTRLSTGIRLATDDLGSFGALPPPLRWRVVADVAASVGLLGLGGTSALTITQLVWGFPASAGGLAALRIASGALTLLGMSAGQRAANVPLGFSATPDVAAPAVALFPAVVDLSLPLSVNPTLAANPLHQLLEVLSEWQPHEWPNRDSYVSALERHLLRRMGWARVERDGWIGPQRADGIAHLIINESLLIEVVHGFDPGTAERVNVRMRSHARTWRGKPALIVVFDASRSALLDSAGTPLLEALHRSYPILTVRMPSARASVV